MDPTARTFLAGLSLLTALALADVLLSGWIMELGGSELNPVMAPFVSDPALFLCMKSLAIAGIGLIALLARRFHREGHRLVLLTSAAIFSQVVAWNVLLVLFRFGLY